MIYNTKYAKIIRSYELSRDLFATELLDFSIGYPAGGQTVDTSALDNVGKSNGSYSYSAYPSTTNEGSSNGQKGATLLRALTSMSSVLG